VSGWYDSGAVVAVNASANAAYQFTGFAGALTGVATPQSVTMTGPFSVSAAFVAVPTFTLSTTAAGLSLAVDGVSCPSPCSVQWPFGSTHSITVPLPAAPPVALATLSRAVTPEPPWYDAGGRWTRRKKLGVHVGQALLKTPGASVLVSITDPDLQQARPGAADIVFTGAGGISKLSHVVEEFDRASGVLIAWVAIPAPSATAGDAIYIYYGNDAAGVR
jgi:hypothetical protein